MVSRPTACDRVLLGELLEARLTDAEQVELSGHLERCESCRKELEAMAAESQWWHDVRRLADTEAFGPAETTGELHHDEPPLAFLAASEHPEHLGKLGPYEVTSIVGRGGMSIVLKAFDPALSRVVAIKVLAPQLATSAAARRRFAREARAAAAVSHDHVVPIHAVDSANGFPYLVMPFLPGRSLQDRIDRDGPLEVEEILRIGMQTAAGLAAAHQQGLVHRDIKPANILLEHGVERVKITDFGLARAMDDASATQSGVVAGTPQYMAPEQTRGGSIDHRADLFSLGSVMYAMATGHSPFRAETTMAVLRRVSDSQPRPVRDINPRIPDWLASIIGKLHEKEPEDRFQSAAEVADLLGRCLAFIQQPSLVPLPRVPRDRRSKPQAGRWQTAAIPLALVAGLVATESAGVTRISNAVMRILRPDSNKAIVNLGLPAPHGVPVADGESVALTHGTTSEDRLPDPNRERRSLDLTPADHGNQFSLTLTQRDHPAPNAAAQEARVRQAAVQDAAREEQDRQRAEIMESAMESALAAAKDNALSDEWPKIPDSPETRAIHIRAQIEKLKYEIKSYEQVLDDANRAGVVSALRKQLERLEKDLIKLAGTALEEPLPIVVPDIVVREVRVLKGDGADISAIAFSSDSRHVLSGGSDHLVKLWDAQTGKVVRDMRGHTGPVLSVAFHPNGESAISAGNDQAIRIWDVQTGLERNKLEGFQGAVESVAVSPDGEFVVAGDGATSHDTPLVHVWRFQCGTEVRALRGHTSGIHSVAVSSDGLKALSGSQDGSARLWDLKTGAELAQLDAFRPVQSAVFTREGANAVLTTDCIRIWTHDRPGETILCDLPQPATTGIVALHGGRDLLTASSRGKSLRAWDAATGRELLIRGAPKRLTASNLAVSPDGRFLLITVGPELRLYELEPHPFDRPEQ